MTLKISINANKTFRIGKGYYRLDDNAKVKINVRGLEPAPFPLKNGDCIDEEDAKGPYSKLWLAVQTRMCDPSAITLDEVKKALQNLRESNAPKLEGLAEIETLLTMQPLHIRTLFAARDMAIDSGEIDSRYTPADPFDAEHWI